MCDSQLLGLPRTSFCMYQETRDRDGEVECTQCLSTLGFSSIARLFAEEEQFSAACHFHDAHLQRNYLSILTVCSFAPWYRRVVSTLPWLEIAGPTNTHLFPYMCTRGSVCVCTVWRHRGKDGKVWPLLAMLLGKSEVSSDSWGLSVPVSQGGRWPSLKGKGEGNWKPRSWLLELCFLPLVGLPSIISTKRHRTPNHFS